MKKTLTIDEIKKVVADTIEQMEAKKGTATAPYIRMDLSSYTADTLEAIKETFLSAGIRFEDRWNDGSDFVVPIDVKCAPSTLRGRRDAFTRSEGPMCDPGQAKKPRNLGRRDAFTRSADRSFGNQNQGKKPSLSDQISSASARAAEASSFDKVPEKEYSTLR